MSSRLDQEVPSRLAASADPSFTRTSRANVADIDFLAAAHPLDRFIQNDEANRDSLVEKDLTSVSELLNRSYTASTKVFQFHELGSVSLEEVMEVDPDQQDLTDRQEKLLVLRHFINHTRDRWAMMKARGHDVEEDPPEQLLKLATAPSAYLIALRATTLENQDRISTDYEHFLGYGLLQLDRADFPDAESIAPEILELGNVHRGLRIMVNNVGSLLVPGGGAVKKIIDEVKEIIGDGVLVTKILVEPKELAYRWSKVALEREGFYDTGHTVTEIVNYQGKPTPITFAWFALSNSTELGIERIKEVEEKYRELDLVTRQRFADTFAHFAPRDACLAVFSRDAGTDVARYGSIYPDNYVLGVEFKHITTPDYQPNVRHAYDPQIIEKIPPRAFDGVINLSVLSDIVNLVRTNELKGLAGETPTEIVCDFLCKQLEMVEVGKKVLTREWLVPDEWAPTTIIEVNQKDGLDDGPIENLEQLSTAKRLEYYAGTAPSFDGASIGFELKSLSCERAGFARFEVDSRYALGFAMVKDYTRLSDFKRETAKIPFLRAHQVVEILENAGARVVSSEPDHNEFLINTRLKGRIYFYSPEEKPLPLPPTQHLILAERVAPSQGVRIEVAKVEVVHSPNYLEPSLYYDTKSDIFREVIARPTPTIEFNVSTPSGATLVVDDFPRPILLDALIKPKLEASQISANVPQPLVGTIDPSLDPRSEAIRILKERAGITLEDISSLEFGTPYFPSPGGTDELVMQCNVTLKHEGFKERTIEGSYSGFSESGRLRMIPENEILQSLQAGSFRDERIARQIMRIRISNGEPLGPWIGNKLNLTPQDSFSLSLQSTNRLLAAQHKIGTNTRWEKVSIPFEDFEYLEVRRAEFVEYNRMNEEIARNWREFVQPRASSKVSSNTIITAPIFLYRGRPTLVLYLREDLPVIEYQQNLHALLTPPAYRLPLSIESFEEGDQFIIEALRKDFELTLRNPHLTPIGKWFPPSAGALNERSWLRVGEVDAKSIDPSRMALVDLEECAQRIAQGGSYCGNLQTAVFRLYHALVTPKP